MSGSFYSAEKKVRTGNFSGANKVNIHCSNLDREKTTPLVGVWEDMFEIIFIVLHQNV